MTEDEARELLTLVFGSEWEMTLIAEGLVGGSEDSEIDADCERVGQLGREHRPDLPDDLVSAVSDAWFTLWCIAPGADPFRV